MSNEIEMHRLTLHMPSRTVMQDDVRSAGNRWPVISPAITPLLVMQGEMVGEMAGDGPCFLAHILLHL